MQPYSKELVFKKTNSNHHTNMNHLKLTTVVLTLSVLIPFSINAQQIDQTFSGISVIDISTGSSDCVVKKGPGSEVNVKLVHTFGDKFKPSVEQKGSKLFIKESQGNHSSRGQATWTLTIPNGKDLKFNTGSGDFRAADLELDISLNAGSGDFSLHGIKGKIVSNAGSGDLEVDNFSGDLTANTGSGDMAVNKVSGDVELNCGSGDIALSDIAGSIEANVGSGDIGADRVHLAGKSRFNSGSGDVYVGLSGSLKHDISVNSGSGDSVLDFNGNDINGTVVMTANKRNGEIHAPFAFDKEEEIDNGSGHSTIKKTAVLGDGVVQIKVGTGSGDARIIN